LHDAFAVARLRLALDKAYSSNMSKDNVERAIKRGTGGLEGANYESIRYEGYGIAGAAVIVDCLTDNKTRTVADVRHAFTKSGGNLGSENSVAFLFKHCGQLIFAPGTDEDKHMEAAIEAGAEDVITNDDGSIEVVTAPNDFVAVRTGLQKASFKAELAEVTFKPTAENVMKGEDAARKDDGQLSRHRHRNQNRIDGERQVDELHPDDGRPEGR
jgi:YebC/PmpR family DNA-binding regulatory protein